MTSQEPRSRSPEQPATAATPHPNQYPFVPMPERFWAKVDKTDTCWLWTGAKTGDGYGEIKVSGRMVPAHRLSWTMAGGTLIEGMTLDHLCRTRACVNPAHLDQVTNKVNILRGNGAPALNARRTHCKRGHLLPERGRCRECARSYGTAWARAKRQEAANAR